MSLSAREQRALASLESRLAVAAPELDSRLAIFTRLAADEEMPRREAIQPGSRWPGSGPRDGRFMLLLWVSATIALTVIAMTVSNIAGPGRCIQPWIMVCAGQVLVPGGRGRPAPPASRTAARQTVLPPGGTR